MDFVSVLTNTSDKSLGYFQSSAKRGLILTNFLGKALCARSIYAEARAARSRRSMIVSDIVPLTVTFSVIDRITSIRQPA